MKHAKYLLLIGVLLCALAFTAACGGGGAQDNNSGPTADFVYVPEYISLPAEIESMQSPAYHDGMVYFTSWGYMLNGAPIAQKDIKETDWDSVESANYMYKIGIDGTGLTQLSDYKQPALPEGAQGSSNLNAMTLDAEGNIWVLENLYTYHIDENENYVDDGEQYFVRKLDSNGAELLSVDISHLKDNTEYFYINNMAVDSAGNVYLNCENSIYVLGPDGSELFSLEVANWVNSMVRLSDGTVGAVTQDETGPVLKPIDVAAKGWGTALPLPLNAYNAYPGSGDYTFYCGDSSNFYGYDTAAKETTKLLNWINCDIDSSNMRGMAALDDGRILCIMRNYSRSGENATNEFVVLTKKPAAEVPQKTVLKLAAVYLDYDLRGTIIDFNKKNQEYRIEVTDYSEFNTEDDYTAGLTKLTTEIISGQVPDLLCTNGLPIEQYVAKGLLEDLYTYLDSDGELSRSSLVEPAMRAMEINGGLYEAATSFSVQALLGNEQYIGPGFEMTMDDMLALRQQYPEASLFSPYFTRDTILYYFCSLNLQSFVDWSTGTCNFDSDEFIKILELANTFPAEYNWDEDSPYMDEYQMLSDGSMLLTMFYAYNFEELQVYETLLNGNAVFKGFPGADGNGVVLQTSVGVAISSKCENKDAAWQFVRTLLSESYQAGGGLWQYPTNKAAFDQMMAKAMEKEYYTDEDGNQVEQPKYGMGFGDGQTIEIYAASQETVDKYLDLIEKADMTVRPDQNLIDIINEEAAAFFAGQKTAKDVAGLIQNRVGIYVNEQR